MITEAELRAAAKARGTGANVLISQLSQWSNSPPPWHEQTVRAAAGRCGYNKTSLEEMLEYVKAEKFTSGELHAAGALIGATQAVSATIGELDARAFSAGQVIEAASLVGWKPRMEEVIAEARRRRQPVIANDDDVLTVGELSAAMKRKWGYKGAALQREVDALMADIAGNRKPEVPGKDDTVSYQELEEWNARFRNENRNAVEMTLGRNFADILFSDVMAHREPGYPDGTVVKDAKDDWWFRTAFGKWEAFGVSGSVAHDVPARPLKVVS